MDIDSLLETIREVATSEYPETPEVAKLCEAIMKWERLHISVSNPQYKEKLTYLLKGVEKRLQERIARGEQER